MSGLKREVSNPKKGTGSVCGACPLFAAGFGLTVGKCTSRQCEESEVPACHERDHTCNQVDETED